MGDDSSNSPVTTIKGSTSKNLGIKTIREPLLDDECKVSCDVAEHKKPDTIAMPTDQTDFRILPDINLYQNKKTVGTGMMDFALLVTNVNQLRHIFNSIDTSSAFFYITLALVITSIILQIVVGIALAINCRYDVKDCDEICKADRINNWITAIIFLITAINVVIPSLGIPEKGL